MPRQKFRPTADALDRLEMIKPKMIRTGQPIADAFYETFWITPADAAAALGISVKTLQRLKLEPRFEFGGRVRYTRDAIYKYIMQNHVVAEVAE